MGNESGALLRPTRVPALPGVPPKVLEARYVTLLARERSPKAVQTLADHLRQADDPGAPLDVRALASLCDDDDGKVAVAAARALGMLQVDAAKALLLIARLGDSRLEDDPDVRSCRSAAGVSGVSPITVIIQRQGSDAITLPAGELDELA